MTTLTTPVTTLKTEHAVATKARVVGAHQSDRPGPTLIVIGAMHGNEPAGIHAAQRVLTRLEEAAPSNFAGRFVALRGNLAALADEDPHLRYIQTDLNRMWTTEGVRLAQQTPAEERHPEQQELVELLEAIEQEHAAARGPVYLIDMHSVSSESPPFVFVEDSLPARQLAMAFEIPIVLGFEEELSGLLVDYCTNTLAMTAMVIEGGIHDDPATVDALEHAIRVALDAIGAWPIDRADQGVNPNAALDTFARGHGRLVYDVRYRYPILHEQFRVDSRLQAFDPIRRDDQVVALDAQQPVTSPIKGLLFMPNRQPRALPGDDGFFIVRRVGFFWLRASALLRSMGALHWLLTTIAPGISRDPESPHRLLVDPDLAVALKREIFHLLGYRIIRQGENRSMSRRSRAMQATFATIRAFISAVFGRMRGSHVPLSQRDDAWIIARRTLDLPRR